MLWSGKVVNWSGEVDANNHLRWLSPLMLLWRVVAAAQVEFSIQLSKLSQKSSHLLDGVIVRWAIGAGWVC